MIERKFVAQKIRENQIQEYMAKVLSKAGYSHTEIRNTPLGEKITIFTTRPGLVVGKSGENVKKITAYLKKRFKLDNPQIEIGEVQNPLLDVQYVADRIAYNLERFGAKRFKSIGYKMLQDVMNAGATGAEIVLSGRIPSARARSWRFSAGHLKKSGDIAVSKVKHTSISVNLTIGTVGVKVSIMTPDIQLPDKLLLATEKEVEVKSTPQLPEQTVVTEKEKPEIKEEKTEEKPKQKKTTKKVKKEKKRKKQRQRAMAIIKKNELKKMDAQHLHQKKSELQKEMIKIRAQLSTKTTPENPGRIKAVKKTIARINTLLTQAKQQVTNPAHSKTTREVKKTKA